jgi:hypothetical protein
MPVVDRMTSTNTASIMAEPRSFGDRVLFFITLWHALCRSRASDDPENRLVSCGDQLSNTRTGRPGFKESPRECELWLFFSDSLRRGCSGTGHSSGPESPMGTAYL